MSVGGRLRAVTHLSRHRGYYVPDLLVALPPPPSASTYRPPPPLLGPPPSTNKICSVPSRCSNVELVAAIATAQWPTSRHHPGPPSSGARCAAFLGLRRPTIKRGEDPYLINIVTTLRGSDSHGCYLLAALATSGINFANDIACRLLYFRRPSAARPPPPTKSPKFANNEVACPASRAPCSITCLLSLFTSPCSGSSCLLPWLDLICTTFTYYGARAAGALLVCDVVAARPVDSTSRLYCRPSYSSCATWLARVGSPAFYTLVCKHVHPLCSCAPEITAATK
ncbi:hypothetical protein B0H14DRAFT_3503348 [Mycena olivaceomarginata]|nr:hypothetical protein B0H14DRAFT_3503348 [Mycena olivaceomarginata]